MLNNVFNIVCIAHAVSASWKIIKIKNVVSPYLLYGKPYTLLSNTNTHKQPKPKLLFLVKRQLLTRTHCLCLKKIMLTLAVTVYLLEAWTADAPSDGHQPTSISAAEHPWCLQLLRILHARATHLHQR